MKKKLMYTCFLLFVGMFCFAQTNQKPQPKTAIPQLKKILAGIDLPIKIVNDTLAAVPYEGAHIASYQVIIQKIGDLYIVYTNLSEAIPNKLSEAQYKYLLQRNEHFDIVKIGLGEDGVFYLRADLYKATATTQVLKRIITQVANVANLIAGDLK